MLTTEQREEIIKDFRAKFPLSPLYMCEELNEDEDDNEDVESENYTCQDWSRA